MTGPEHVVVRALGVAVGIPAADAETADRLRRQWSRALTSEPAEVMIDADGLADAEPDLHDYAVTVRVTMRALEATAGTRLNVHAGAVADDEGNALAVVGASGSGKTTAIRALASRLGYLSDETVSVGDDLALFAHPKPLSVITDPAHPRRKSSLSPDDAGLVRTPEHATLRRIVLLRRGHGTHGLSPVPAPEAIVEIVPQTSSLTLLEAPLLRLSRTLEQCGGAFALHYDEVGDHLDELADLLASPPGETPEAVHHPAVGTAAPTAGQWSRGPWVDAVQFDDELVVLVGSVATVLAGLGTTLWLALAQPATSAELLALAEAEHGSHPDAAALVDEALDQLRGSGLVTPPG